MAALIHWTPPGQAVPVIGIYRHLQSAKAMFSIGLIRPRQNKVETGHLKPQFLPVVPKTLGICDPVYSQNISIMKESVSILQQCLP